MALCLTSITLVFKGIETVMNEQRYPGAIFISLEFNVKLTRKVVVR